MGNALAVVGGDGGGLATWAGGGILLGTVGAVADTAAGLPPLNGASLYELLQLAVLVLVLRSLGFGRADKTKGS